MREYARAESNPQLLRGGTNLSAVLFALSAGDKEQQAALQRITEIVRQIPEEPFAEIGFAETSLGDVMAGFVADERQETSGGKLVDARLLSDGTLRMLAIVTALETVPGFSRIVIEEFDNGLHPSRAKLLVRTLSETAKRRELNVLVTTHNPAFMDALDESQIDSVLICHGNESGGMLAIVTAMETVPDSSRIVIEEIRHGCSNSIECRATSRNREPILSALKRLSSSTPGSSYL